MRPHPIYHPFVEAGYGGYSLRGVAHLQADRTFRPSLEIRDYRYAAGELSYACVFEKWYLDPDTAIQCALDTGRQLIDNLLDLVNLDTRIETNEAYPLARFRHP